MLREEGLAEDFMTDFEPSPCAFGAGGTRGRSGRRGEREEEMSAAERSGRSTSVINGEWTVDRATPPSFQLAASVVDGGELVVEGVRRSECFSTLPAHSCSS